MEKKMKKIRRHRYIENRGLVICNYLILIIIGIASLLPFLNVVAKAFSAANVSVNFTPKGFNWFSFVTVLKDSAYFRALCISAIVTLVGTILSVSIMFMAAYALSKKDFPCRRGIMIFFIITMIFSGGMVPNYLVMRSLGLTGTIFSLIFPSVLQVYNLILIKSYLENLPQEIEESAMIDGASELRIMLNIILPISLPCIASVALFTAVSYWNNYTNALLYLGTSEEWYPLSLYILNHIQLEPPKIDQTQVDIYKANIDSAMIFISILPILIVYPFVLKNFTKGVTVGGVKG